MIIQSNLAFYLPESQTDCICSMLFVDKYLPIDQWSPTFLAPGTGFTEENLSMDKFERWGAMGSSN